VRQPPKIPKKKGLALTVLPWFFSFLDGADFQDVRAVWVNESPACGCRLEAAVAMMGPISASGLIQDVADTRRGP